MRCKACDCKLAEHDMYIRDETGEFEDLCVVCRKASQVDDEVEEELDKVFVEEHVTTRLGWED